jgi:hypothetical protein
MAFGLHLGDATSIRPTESGIIAHCRKRLLQNGHFGDRLYHREAILTCASALDAYLDFHVAVLMRSTASKKEDVDALLKFISKQAERRLGAFLAAETAISKQQPGYIRQPMIELRNNIVHKGYIPTQDEAFGYLQHVLDFIVARYAALHHQHSDTIHKIFFERVAALPPPSTPNHSHPTMAWITVIDFLTFRKAGDQSTLTIYLDKIREKKRIG